MAKSMLVVCLLSAALLTPFASANAPSPYSGQESREIKALSSDEVQAYLAGNGMGLAKAAELNGYPGPLHVLPLSSELGLTTDQKERTERLFAAMQSRAKALGHRLVEKSNDSTSYSHPGQLRKTRLHERLHGSASWPHSCAKCTSTLTWPKSKSSRLRKSRSTWCSADTRTCHTPKATAATGVDGVLLHRASADHLVGSPSTSICIISPPPPFVSTLLFVVWCEMWQWIIHFPAFSAGQMTSYR